MVHVGYVDSESGPLMIADAHFARAWKGSETDDSDYERACDLLDQEPAIIFAFGQGHGIIWDCEEGTNDVFVVDMKRVVIVGAVLDEPNEDTDASVVSALASLPAKSPLRIGRIDVPSGLLAIIWAPEDGECITSFDVETSARPAGQMSTASSGLLVRVVAGSYLVTCDEVEHDNSSAIRCHLELSP